MQDYQTLISAATLAEEIDNPVLRIVDCRFNLLHPGAGRQSYLEAHIPGAVYAHLDDDLAAPITRESGRHPLPDPTELAAFFGRIGIARTMQVVVYDDASGAIAARAWWLLRWLGHSRVAVLDGGFAQWQKLGLRLESGATDPEPKEFLGETQPERVLETAEVVAGIASPTRLPLVDARDAARFRGEQEPIDAVAGHIPGATNLPCSRNIGQDGLWKDSTELRQMWSETVPEALRAPFGVMCGSGVTACQLVLSSLVAGIDEPKVYIGSWSEWIRDRERPVVREMA